MLENHFCDTVLLNTTHFDIYQLHNHPKALLHDETLRQHLIDCKREHEQLKEEIQTLLDKFHDEGKEPNPMAKGMSWVKTNAKLVMHESDQTIADLITDGCNMGVKSLNKYLNQYEAADEKTKVVLRQEKVPVKLKYFI